METLRREEVRMREEAVYSESCCAIRDGLANRLGGTPTDDEIRTAMENCYRRGFTQGAAEAISCLERGRGFPALRSWLDRLMKWRSVRHKGKSIPPERSP